MKGELETVKNECYNLAKEIINKFTNYRFNFGGVFYRDPIDQSSDINESFNLTNDLEGLRDKFSGVKLYGGGDTPEDWVGAYREALNMRWRDGIKLIIHIADAGAHGVRFSPGDKHDNEGQKLPPLIKKCCDKGITIIGFSIKNEPKNSFRECKNIYDSHKSYSSGSEKFYEIYNFRRGIFNNLKRN